MLSPAESRAVAAAIHARPDLTLMERFDLAAETAAAATVADLPAWMQEAIADTAPSTRD